MSLLAVVVTGIVPAKSAFEGMGHPAVITVAAVLIIIRGLTNAGIVTVLASWLERFGTNIYLQIGALVALVTVASGFMNNVGALALTMPLAIGMADRAGRSPSYYLIPIAFGSLLGGITTLIGTPPNLIISGFREQAAGEGYAMFDFMWAGGLTALAGVVFLTIIGWKFMPVREGQASADRLFHIEDYLVEIRIPPGSEFIGKPIDSVAAFHETDTIYVGLSRGVTMALSNIINNAAAAVLMAPIAIGVAKTLGLSVAPFLMATCIACSSPFLTPIGHQSCTLVMGPGGYRFSDYWRLGLPLSAVVMVCAIPLVLWFWPM